jgi:NAD(P)-dependent dehydrogenase (short-subunit alcohol dehydrogenase family)
MSKQIAFIIGYGANIGSAVAKKFSNNGYSVAVAARRQAEGKTSEGYQAYKVDLSAPASIPALFEKVRAEVGIPSVVIYNGI